MAVVLLRLAATPPTIPPLNHSAKIAAAGAQVVHGDLIGRARFRRAEENAAVATPIGFASSVNWKLRTSVGDEHPAMGVRMLRPDEP